MWLTGRVDGKKLLNLTISQINNYKNIIELLNFMQELIKLVIGIMLLALGIPIGNILAKITKEELKSGKKWFKLIVMISLIFGVYGLLIKNDILLFSLFFIAIVTSRSLKR